MPPTDPTVRPTRTAPHAAPHPPIADPPIRLAVLASGGGTTLQNLIDRIAEGRLDATIAQVIVSKPGVGAIERAKRAGVPVAVVPRGGMAPEAYEKAVFDLIRAAGVDLVVLAGFLSLLPIPEDYRGRIMNVHPSLLPSFGGRGFHGEAVHRAAIEVGVKLSGCTVHFVDELYDNGPIILQRPVPVLDDDTSATLAARVQPGRVRCADHPMNEPEWSAQRTLPGSTSVPGFTRPGHRPGGGPGEAPMAGRAGVGPPLGPGRPGQPGLARGAGPRLPPRPGRRAARHPRHPRPGPPPPRRPLRPP